LTRKINCPPHFAGAPKGLEDDTPDEEKGYRTWYKKYKEPPKDLFSIDFGQGAVKVCSSDIPPPSRSLF